MTLLGNCTAVAGGGGGAGYIENSPEAVQVVAILMMSGKGE